MKRWKIDGDTTIVFTARAPVQSGVMTIEDHGVEPGVVYRYLLTVWGRDGSRTELGPLTLQLDAPQEIALRLQSSNPSRQGFRFDVAMPRAAVGSLEILDVQGRRVQLVFTGEFKPGHTRLAWDGRTVPGGVYWVRFDAGSFTETKKVTLIR